MIGAALCYLAAGLSTNVILAFVACIFTGLFTSMLWPGTLILMEKKIPAPGIAAYALMAAGGDLGASIAPRRCWALWLTRYPSAILPLRSGKVPS